MQLCCACDLQIDELSKLKNVSFYRFPGFSNKEWRKLWFSALNYPAEESDRPPSAKEELLLICSRHFTPDSFIDGYRLKKNAVPTLHISVTKTITRESSYFTDENPIAVGQAYSFLAQPDSPSMEDSLSCLGNSEDDSDCEHVSELTSYAITNQGLIQSEVTNPRHRAFHNEMEIVTIPDSDDDELNLLSSLTEARVSQIEEDWTDIYLTSDEEQEDPVTSPSAKPTLMPLSYSGAAGPSSLVDSLSSSDSPGGMTLVRPCSVSRKAQNTDSMDSPATVDGDISDGYSPRKLPRCLASVVVENSVSITGSNLDDPTDSFMPEIGGECDVIDGHAIYSFASQEALKNFSSQRPPTPAFIVSHSRAQTVNWTRRTVPSILHGMSSSPGCDSPIRHPKESANAPVILYMTDDPYEECYGVPEHPSLPEPGSCGKLHCRMGCVCDSLVYSRRSHSKNLSQLSADSIIHEQSGLCNLKRKSANLYKSAGARRSLRIVLSDCEKPSNKKQKKSKEPSAVPVNILEENINLKQQLSECNDCIASLTATIYAKEAEIAQLKKSFAVHPAVHSSPPSTDIDCGSLPNIYYGDGRWNEPLLDRLMKNSKSPSVFVLKLLSQMFQPGMSRGVSKIPEELKEAVINVTIKRFKEVKAKMRNRGRPLGLSKEAIQNCINTAIQKIQNKRTE